MIDKLLLYKTLKNKSGAEISASGNPVTLSGTLVDNPLKDCKIYGWSKQETTIGAQLFNASKFDEVEQYGVKLSVKDGVIYAEGTPTQDAWITAKLTADEIKKVFKNGKLTIKSEEVNSCNFSVGLYFEFIPTAFSGDGSLIDLTLPENITDGCVYYYVNLIKGTEMIGGRKIMLYQDGNGTWEPYTGGKPSPSPEYPQEIISAGMKWSTGANLWDINGEIDYKIITESNNPSANRVNGNVVTCNVNSNVSACDGAKVSVKPNTTYCFSCDVLSLGTGTGFYIGVNGTDINRVLNAVNKTGHAILKITTNDTDEELVFGFATINGTGAQATNVMLSECDTELPWEPYTGGIPKLYGDKINLEVHGKNLFNITTESKCDKTGASSTKRIILPGEYILGLTYTNICANYLDNVFISQERISFFSSGVGYGIGIGVIAEKGKKYVISGEYKNGDTRMVFYDKSGGIICNTDDNPFVVPEGTKYAVLLLRKSKNTTDKIVFKNIQVEEAISPTAYEPYHEPQSISISTPTGLPAIPVNTDGNYTDVNGQQWIADYVDLKRGKYVQWIGKCNLENLSWRLNGNIFNSSEINNSKKYGWTTEIANLICSHYVCNMTAYNMNFNSDGLDNLIGMYDKDVVIKDTRFNNDVELFKKSLNGVYVYYVLNEPIERDLTPEEIQAYKNLVTYAGTTILENDADCYMEVSAGGGYTLRAKKLALILGD